MKLRVRNRGRRRRVALFVAAVVALATAALLAVVAPARGETAPLVSLGPMTVGDGVATLSGSVGSAGAAADITVNGQPVRVNASGTFAANIALGGASKIVFTARNPSNGESFTITIPLSTAGPDGVIAEPLALLKKAGISLTIPPDGFTSLDGQPLTVLGRVLDPDTLRSFAVNGREILGAIPSNGVFSERVSGSSESVTVSATDSRGVSQSSTFPVAHVSSVITTKVGTSVSAVGARGLRIATVRYLTKGVAKTRRMKMVVTIRDFRGLLVRGAIVTIKKAPKAKTTIGGRQVKLSNTRGQATFPLRLRPEVFAKRLSVAALARTPSARAEKVTSVKLPKLRPTTRARRT